MLSKKKSNRQINIDGINYPATVTGTGHASPRVIFRESANVASAPKNVKNHFISSRNYFGDSGFFISNHKYGERGVLDKTLSNYISNDASKFNRKEWPLAK